MPANAARKSADPAESAVPTASVTSRASVATAVNAPPVQDAVASRGGDEE